MTTYRLYEHVSSMWEYEGWLPQNVTEYASTHYAAYAVKRTDGLKIITLDTDICELSLTKNHAYP